jgi:hypothetical protein
VIRRLFKVLAATLFVACSALALYALVAALAEAVICYRRGTHLFLGFWIFLLTAFVCAVASILFLRIAVTLTKRKIADVAAVQATCESAKISK